jgi:hypothetical protein
VVPVRRDEVSGPDDSFEIVVRIREAGSTACGEWQLTVLGHAEVAAATCP